MVERRHLIHDFVDAAPWPNATAEALGEIKAIFAGQPEYGDKLGRSVAVAIIMESIGFSNHLMQVAQRMRNPQARMLFTLTARRMAGAFGNPAYSYLNADHIHRTGQPLLIPRDIQLTFESFVDEAAQSVGINPADHEGKRLADEVDWMMTEQTLARMIPTVSTLEFIDKYTELALHRLKDDDFNAPPREGFLRGKERFHTLYQAGQTALGLT